MAEAPPVFPTKTKFDILAGSVSPVLLQSWYQANANEMMKQEHVTVMFVGLLMYAGSEPRRVLTSLYSSLECKAR